MNLKQLSDKLYFEISKRRNLRSSKKKILELISSLFKIKPDLQLLFEKKEDFTEEDLKLVLAHLMSDKKIDKKEYQKKYVKLSTYYHPNDIDKTMVYEAMLLAFYVYLIFLMHYVKPKKTSKNVQKI